MKTGAADLATTFGPRETPTTTSRVILGYQGEGRAVGEIASDGFPLGQTQFTDAYVNAGGRLTFDRAAVQPGTRELGQRLAPAGLRPHRRLRTPAAR